MGWLTGCSDNNAHSVMPAVISATSITTLAHRATGCIDQVCPASTPAPRAANNTPLQTTKATCSTLIVG